MEIGGGSYPLLRIPWIPTSVMLEREQAKWRACVSGLAGGRGRETKSQAGNDAERDLSCAVRWLRWPDFFILLLYRLDHRLAGQHWNVSCSSSRIKGLISSRHKDVAWHQVSSIEVIGTKIIIIIKKWSLRLLGLLARPWGSLPCLPSLPSLHCSCSSVKKVKSHLSLP